MSVIDIGSMINFGWSVVYSSDDTYEFYRKHDILRNTNIKSKTKINDDKNDTHRYTILVKTKDSEHAKKILGVE